MNKIRKEIPFPFPLVTGSSHNGTIEITLSKETLVPQDEDLPFYVQELIEQREIVLYLNESLNGPLVEGRSVFSRDRFIETNWEGDTKKQNEIKNILGSPRSLEAVDEEVHNGRAFNWTITKFKKDLFEFQITFNNRMSISVE